MKIFKKITILICLNCWFFETQAKNFYDLSTTSDRALKESSRDVRGSTYSYYYISRRVWYIPLWFLIYFCCYILGLIIRSIILHKVIIIDKNCKEKPQRSTSIVIIIYILIFRFDQTQQN